MTSWAAFWLAFGFIGGCFWFAVTACYIVQQVLVFQKELHPRGPFQER